MRYHIKTFNSWVNESKTNEGVAEFVRKVSSKFMAMLTKFRDLIWNGNKFEGRGSSFLNDYSLYKQGRTPKGIDFYPTKTIEEVVDASKFEKSDATDQMDSMDSTEPMAYNESLQSTYYEDAIMEMDDYIESLKQVQRINEETVEQMHPNMKMKNMKRGELFDILQDIVDANKMGLSEQTEHLCLFIWGAPGVSKTSLMKELAAKNGMQCMIINMSIQPPDCLLIPAQNTEGTVTMKVIDNLPLYDTTAADWKEQEERKNCPVIKGQQMRGGILFLDELPRAETVNIAPALSLIQDRGLDRFEVASDWVFVGAGNRKEDDMQNLFRIKSPALWSRWLHCNLLLTNEDWATWAETVKAKDPSTGEEVKVIDPALAAFVRFNPDYFYDLSSEDDENLELHNIPRTWHKGAIAVFQANQIRKKKGLPELSLKEIEDRYALAVGIPAAKEFVGFLKLSRSFNPNDIQFVWKDQKKAPLPPKETSKAKEGAKGFKSDAIGAMMAAIFAQKKGQKLKFEEVKNFIDYLIRLDEPQWAMKAITYLLDTHTYLNPADESQLVDKKHPNYDAEAVKSIEYINKEFGDKYEEFLNSGYAN